MSDKQPSIPGLESPPACLNSPRKIPVQPVDRIAFLEKRVVALELELFLLKIQMEVDCA